MPPSGLFSLQQVSRRDALQRVGIQVPNSDLRPGEHETPRSILTLLAAVDELSSVDALSSDEELRSLLEAVRVTEGHFGQGSATAGVMNDILNWGGGGFKNNNPLQPTHQTDKSPGSLQEPAVAHLHDSLDVTMAFSEVNVTEFSCTFPVLDVGFEHGARTFSLSPDHTSHRLLKRTEQTERYEHMKVRSLRCPSQLNCQNCNMCWTCRDYSKETLDRNYFS